MFTQKKQNKGKMSESKDMRDSNSRLFPEKRKKKKREKRKKVMKGR